MALTAAAWTGGLVDPTVGGALTSLGYDRDFAAIDAGRPRPSGRAGRRRRDGSRCGWTARCCACPPGCWLDLGATAKGLGSDRAARAAQRRHRDAGGVLVSLGGDIAIGGIAARGRLAGRVG